MDHENNSKSEAQISSITETTNCCDNLVDNNTNIKPNKVLSEYEHNYILI